MLLGLNTLVLAQRSISEDAPHTFKERGYFGGGFGLNSGRDAFGNSYFYYAVNPIIGYMITPQFSSGIGISWQSTSYNDLKPSVTLSQFGFSPFVRYNFDQLFAYSEFNQVISSNSIYRNYSRMLLGLGYSQPLGGRGAINAMALYDVLYNQNDILTSNKIGGPTSPWVFRVFFSF